MTVEEQQRESVGLSVLVPAELRDAVVELAAAEERSIGGQVRILLGEALERRTENGGR